jgi:uncharacterized repeat protein (TIGR03803 family)
MNCFQRHSRLSILKDLPVAAFAAVIVVMTLVAAPRAQGQTYTVLHVFAGGSTDGSDPNGEMIRDDAGNLYGTTNGGGTSDGGTVFKLDPSGVLTILSSLDGHPDAGLFRDPAGNLYGTTMQGGRGNNGTVFMLDTNNVLTTLYTFKGGTDGAQPQFKLVSVNGELYGTTRFGGDLDCTCGVVFKVTKSGKEEVLYRFTGGADGAQPQGLVRDSAGNLYGVATSDTLPSFGTVFELDTAGVFTVLYTFKGGADGENPVGRLIRDTNGNIHGVTAAGGDPGGGTVFRLDAAGNKTVLHNFFAYGGGYQPVDGLIDVAGTLYGTTLSGGDFPKDCPDGCGLLYQIGKTGQYTVLHRFAGLAAGDGNSPNIGQLTLGADGSIYGATSIGGNTCPDGNGATLGCGVIFKYTPASE